MELLSVEVMLLGLALLCLPNLFYRATFNIPLLCFVALIWKTRHTLASQLLVVSWLIELYQLLDILVNNNLYILPQKLPVLLAFTVLVFVLKVPLPAPRPSSSPSSSSKTRTSARPSPSRAGSPASARASRARSDVFASICLTLIVKSPPHRPTASS
jgi:hypothetical protein